MISNGPVETKMENGECVSFQPRQDKACHRFRKFVMDNLYLICNIVGIIVGFLVGLLARSQDLRGDGIMWLGLPGELYMRMLTCIIIPLIVCNVIDGTANTDPKTNGRVGLVSLSYMLLSNSVGACLGLVWCLIIKPGSGTGKEQAEGGVDTKGLTTTDIIADFIRNVFPPNLIGAALQVSQTQYKPTQLLREVNISGHVINETMVVMTKSLGTVNSTNILGLIVISAALGVAASQSGEHGQPVVAFFKSGAHIIFKLFNWIKWSTPLGSASLIAASVAGLDDLGPALRSMGLFSLMFALGNWVMIQLMCLSIVFFLGYRQSPVRLMAKSARAWLISFGTINSTIPYPEYLRVAEHFGVNPRATEYVLPLCVTLNRCGSAAFITSACVFVTQYTGIGTGVGNVFVIGLLGILASLAIPSVNSSSVVAIVIILGSLGVPTSSTVGLIMSMEWLNDRVRATTNAMSHIVCVLTTWRLSRQGFMPVPTKCDDIEADHRASSL